MWCRCEASCGAYPFGDPHGWLPPIHSRTKFVPCCNLACICWSVEILPGFDFEIWAFIGQGIMEATSSFANEFSMNKRGHMKMCLYNRRRMNIWVCRRHMNIWVSKAKAKQSKRRAKAKQKQSKTVVHFSIWAAAAAHMFLIFQLFKSGPVRTCTSSVDLDQLELIFEVFKSGPVRTCTS